MKSQIALLLDEGLFFSYDFKRTLTRFSNCSLVLALFLMSYSQNRIKIFPLFIATTVWLSHLLLIYFEANTFVCYISCQCFCVLLLVSVIESQPCAARIPVSCMDNDNKWCIVQALCVYNTHGNSICHAC